jgi:hypothetical protein
MLREVGKIDYFYARSVFVYRLGYLACVLLPLMAFLYLPRYGIFAWWRILVWQDEYSLPG